MDRLVVQEPLQIVGQFLGRGVAALRLGGHRFQDNRFQVARDGVVDLSRRGRIAVDNLMHQEMPIVALERWPECQQFVQCDSQRIDVRAMVQHLAVPLSLFRAHVAQRAQQIAGHGEIGPGPGLGQPEVGDQQMPLGVDEQVRRLDVSVDHAHLVGMLEGFSRLRPPVGHGAEEPRRLTRSIRRYVGLRFAFGLGGRRRRFLALGERPIPTGLRGAVVRSVRVTAWPCRRKA